MKIINPRIPLLLLSLTGVCGAWPAIQTGFARSSAAIRPSNHDRVGSTGAHWIWQNPLPQGNTLYGLSFADVNTGKAMGDNGTIVQTTDGGNNWVIQSSGTTNTLYGVSFTDLNQGTVVGASGTILRTTDGGNTWVGQTSGTTDGLLAVSFTDANTGTAVGETETIVRTIDGGNTWIGQASGTTNNLNAVSFTDANNGTAVSWYRHGLVRRVGPRAFFGASRLLTQITGQLLAATEPSSEQRMEEPRGLPRQAERPTL
jgi:hypothetical protein